MSSLAMFLSKIILKVYSGKRVCWYRRTSIFLLSKMLPHLVTSPDPHYPASPSLSRYQGFPGVGISSWKRPLIPFTQGCRVLPLTTQQHSLPRAVVMPSRPSWWGDEGSRGVHVCR